jgi:hypothetical protein
MFFAGAQAAKSIHLVMFFGLWEIESWMKLTWWAHQDLNLEPTDYESAALTVEL